MAVKGLKEFERRFKAIPEEIRKQVAYELERIADGIVGQMYSQAPHRTGDLAGTIDWTWGNAPAGALTLGNVRGNKYGTMQITIYAGDEHAFYARFQEFGTVKMPANPFFFPVWRANRKRVKGSISRAVTKAIKTA